MENRKELAKLYTMPKMSENYDKKMPGNRLMTKNLLKNIHQQKRVLNKLE